MKTFLAKHKSGILADLFLFALAFVVYLPTLNGAQISDDYGLTDLGQKYSFTELGSLFSAAAPSFLRPFPMLTWWIQFQVAGIHALPSHLLNTGLHAGTACILFWFLSRVGVGRIASLLAASLFVLTPIAPEAVTWAAGRYDVMALFFIMLTICLYYIAIQKRSRAILAGSLAAAALALLSKEAALTLVVLVPLAELMFGFMGTPAAAGGTSAAADTTDAATVATPKQRLIFSTCRLAPFIILFAGYFLLRWSVLGSMGGYSNVSLFGAPGWEATKSTFWVLLTPFNSIVFQDRTINLVGLYVGLLCLLSLALVLLRWRRTEAPARRAWAFMAAFFLCSLLPVYSSVFMGDYTQTLRESRYLYIPTLGLITVMVVGLMEFGWKSRMWRVPVTAALALLVPLYFWGLNHNNRPWERASSITAAIPEETRLLLPDPAPETKIFFQMVPRWSGAYVYVNGLTQAVHWKYGRTDLKIYCIDGQIDPADAADGYLFLYDEGSGNLKMVRRPYGPAGPTGFVPC